MLTDEFNDYVRQKYQLATAEDIQKLDYKERNQ
jgi:hypothetical protein